MFLCFLSHNFELGKPILMIIYLFKNGYFPSGGDYIHFRIVVVIVIIVQYQSALKTFRITIRKWYFRSLLQTEHDKLI